MEIAKELGLRYFAMVMSDATTASEFKGYKNVVDGSYVTTEFRDAFENGGLYVLEELNATTSNMPIIFNSIENGYFVFADKLVYMHPDFRLCATMNTITNAHDFGGRRNLDKSVRSRFHTIIVNTDFNTRFSTDIVWLQKEIANALEAKGHSSEIDPRDIRRYLKLIELGIDPTHAIHKTLDKERILAASYIESLIKQSKDK
jgi:midasin (ATPase involved in ribosome maturation)